MAIQTKQRPVHNTHGIRTQKGTQVKKANLNPRAKKSPSPVTHSEVLWHFTGGPLWNQKKNTQYKSPKLPGDAYKILLEIIESKNLRIGGYHELIKVTVPKQIRFDSRTRKVITSLNVTHELKTSPVCCVADIPENGLKIHSNRYGKFAIGFKRNSIVKAGFNPVFYTFDTQSIARSYLQANSLLSSFDSGTIQQAIESIKDEIQSDYQNKLEDLRNDLQNDDDLQECPHCHKEIESNSSIESGMDRAGPEIDFDETDIEQAFTDVDDLFSNGLTELKHLMSYVKTFSDSEFNTIYAEREWRSLSQFRFTWADIDSIVLPKKGGYAHRFDAWKRGALKFPKQIKVKIWEEMG